MSKKKNDVDETLNDIDNSFDDNTFPPKKESGGKRKEIIKKLNHAVKHGTLEEQNKYRKQLKGLK